MLLLLILGGLVFTVSGGYGVRQDRRLTRTGQQVPGTVVGLRWNYSINRDAPASGSRVCYPVLAFRTLDGHDVQTASRVGSSKVIAQTGDQVTVLYDPRNPARAEINTSAGRATWLPYLITVAGLAVLGYGVYRAAYGS